MSKDANAYTLVLKAPYRSDPDRDHTRTSTSALIMDAVIEVGSFYMHELAPKLDSNSDSASDAFPPVEVSITLEDARDIYTWLASNVLRGEVEVKAGAILSLLEVLEQVYAWQDATFPNRTPAGVAAHLREEAKELSVAPTSSSEIADVAMLLFSLVRDTNTDLAAAIRDKLAINMQRTFSEIPNADGYYKAEPEPEPEPRKHAMKLVTLNALNGEPPVYYAQCLECDVYTSKYWKPSDIGPLYHYV